MKSYRQLIPTLAIALTALLLGSFLPLSDVFGQDGQLPVAQSAASPDAIEAALGTAFTYQGNLKKSGQPVTANCSFQFSLWDALSGGAQQATTQIVNNTQVEAGSFTVQLDFGNQFTGEVRWLQTAVQCAGDGGYVTLTPRQPLNAVPYAMGLRPGAVMESAAPGDAFYVEETAANSNAIHGRSTETGSIGVWGEGIDYTGVYGLSRGGKGVWGASTSESGVYGVSESWAGVWGESTGASGVVGMSNAQYSAGVWGENTGQGRGVVGKSSADIGVYGESTTWAGVWGQSTGASGVVGMSNAQYSAGVWGENTGQGRGVVGKSSADIGVYGESTTWAGVWGQSTGASGVVGVSPGQFNGGVYGENTGQGYGVYGKSANGLGVYGQSTNRIGVYGRSTNQTGVVGESDSHDGVRGTTTATSHIGVKGIANSIGSVGVWGESAANTGVYGQSGAASGAALWGKNTAGGIALKVEGNAVQSLAMNGLPKAMAFVEGDEIVRCYNGVTGQSSGNCGFSADWSYSGEHGDNSNSVVDFGFNVEQRFIVANLVDWTGIDLSKAFHLRTVAGNQVTLLNWVCVSTCGGGIFPPFDPWRNPMAFYIIVY